VLTSSFKTYFGAGRISIARWAAQLPGRLPGLQTSGTWRLVPRGSRLGGRAGVP